MRLILLQMKTAHSRPTLRNDITIQVNKTTLIQENSLSNNPNQTLVSNIPTNMLVPTRFRKGVRSMLYMPHEHKNELESMNLDFDTAVDSESEKHTMKSNSDCRKIKNSQTLVLKPIDYELYFDFIAVNVILNLLFIQCFGYLRKI